MSNYRIEYRSSSEQEMLKSLTDLNHIYNIRTVAPSNYIEIVFNLFKEVGLIEEKISVNRDITLQYTITNWKHKDNEEDLCVFYKDDKIGYWIPKVELHILLDTMKRLSCNINWGYIDGRVSHLGFAARHGMMSANMLNGYTLWIEVKGENVEISKEREKELNIKNNNTITISEDLDVFGLKKIIKNNIENLLDELDSKGFNSFLIGEFDDPNYLTDCKEKRELAKKEFIKATKNLIDVI